MEAGIGVVGSCARDDDGRGIVNIHGVRIIAWTSYILLNVLYILACLQRTAIPGAVFDDIQSSMGLLGSQVTGLGATFLVAYASSQVFAGMLVDRFGAKRMAILGGVLLGAGLLWFSCARSVPALYAGRVVSAFGQAFIYLCVVKICHLLFPPKVFGALVGYSIAVGFAGGILGTMPVAHASAIFGWRPLFIAIGLMCVASAAAIAIALNGMHERRRKSGSVTLATLSNLFNERGRFCFMSYNFFVFPAFFVLQSIMGQKFIQDHLGYSAGTASTFTMLLTFGSMLMGFVGGPVMRLFGGRRVPLVRLSAALPLLLTLALIAGVRFSWPGWAFLSCFALMSLTNVATVATSALMGELTDTKTIAFGAAVRNSFPYIGSAIVGAACGRIFDTFAPLAVTDAGVVHYPAAAYIRILTVIATLVLVGLLLTLGIPETHGRHLYSDHAR